MWYHITMCKLFALEILYRLLWGKDKTKKLKKQLHKKCKHKYTMYMIP